MADRLDRPHFVIIGAMKCATTTLHDQLAAQPGVFMSDPKEPNFFSDDDHWARGLGWYRALFQNAPPAALCGESSTHYTKLPMHPDAAERLHRHLPDARLVYVMRDPIDRLVSQYIHEWSVRAVSEPIDQAVRSFPPLIAYSKYAMQLRPWLDRFGPDRVLPVFFERLTRDPQAELERVWRFVWAGRDAAPARPVWRAEAGARNVSAQRVRRGPVLDRLLRVRVLQHARRTLLPESLRERIKRRWRMEDRPTLSETARAWCVDAIDPDMAELGRTLGTPLSCDTFRDAVLNAPAPPEWAAPEATA